MKKSKILSLTLTLALVFTTVFAGTESIFAESSKVMAMSSVSALEEDENTLAAVNINTGTADWFSVSYGYNTSGTYFYVNMPAAGTIMLDVLASTTSYAQIWTVDENGTPAECLKKVDVTEASSTSDYVTVSTRVSGAGKYCVILSTSYNTTASGYVRAYYAPSATTVTAKNGKDYYASNKSGTTRYYKITTAGTGYLTINFPYGSGGDSSKYSIKVMNSKKNKTLSKETVNYNKNFVTYAGLVKGTYYVAVTSSTDDWYAINIKATKTSENSGSTRSKAKLMSKGITKKGIVTATQTNKTADWYKIKLNGNQPVVLNINTKTGGASGGIRVSVYSGNKKNAFATMEHFYGDPGSGWNLYTTINGVKMNYLQKGTYYIKVTKYGSGNGYYDLSWQ